MLFENAGGVPSFIALHLAYNMQLKFHQVLMHWGLFAFLFFVSKM